jgi:hypothetical protein
MYFCIDAEGASVLGACWVAWTGMVEISKGAYGLIVGGLCKADFALPSVCAPLNAIGLGEASYK